MKLSVHSLNKTNIAATFLVTAGMVFAMSASAYAAPMSAVDQKAVDDIVAASMKTGNQPGVSISLTGPKGDYTKAYGVGNRNAKTALSINDYYRIGSVTKTFVSTAVLMQVDQGKIKLTDKLDQYVTGVPKGKDITIRDLLSMRSGVYDFQSDFFLQLVFALWPTSKITSDDALRSIKSHGSLFTPGTKYHYNNSNYILLGALLEKVTGKKIQDIITNDVIKPLGLTQTSFPVSDATIPTPFARGYNPGFIFTWTYRDTTALNPNLFGPSGAMISTIGDMQKYGQKLRDGALLTPASNTLRKQTFCAVPFTGGGPTEFGYGLGMISFGKWIGHDGSIPGYSSAVLYNKENGAVITGMENMQTNNIKILSVILNKIGDYLYPGSMSTEIYPNKLPDCKK